MTNTASKQKKYKRLALRCSGSVSQSKRYTRSRVGNVVYVVFLLLFGIFSVLPLIYCITTSFKPLDELLIFPPTLFTVKRPTIANYTAIPDLLSGLSVPITRYAFNSIFVSIIGTFLSVIISAMAAFVLSKTEMKFNKLIFTVVQFSLLFNAYTLSVPPVSYTHLTLPTILLV